MNEEFRKTEPKKNDIPFNSSNGYAVVGSFSRRSAVLGLENEFVLFLFNVCENTQPNSNSND